MPCVLAPRSPAPSRAGARAALRGGEQGDDVCPGHMTRGRPPAMTVLMVVLFLTFLENTVVSVAQERLAAPGGEIPELAGESPAEGTRASV